MTSGGAGRFTRARTSQSTGSGSLAPRHASLTCSKPVCRWPSAGSGCTSRRASARLSGFPIASTGFTIATVRGAIAATRSSRSYCRRTPGTTTLRGVAVQRLVDDGPPREQGVLDGDTGDSRVDGRGMQRDHPHRTVAIDGHLLPVDVRSRQQPVCRSQHVVHTQPDQRAPDEQRPQRQQVMAAEQRRLDLLATGGRRPAREGPRRWRRLSPGAAPRDPAERRPLAGRSPAAGRVPS